MTSDAELHRRLLTWQDALRTRMASQRLDLPFAVCLIAEDMPEVFDLNLMVVTAPVSAAVLLRSIDRVAAAASWRHRRIEVDDAGIERRLRQALLDNGYTVERYVTMRFEGEGPPAQDRLPTVIADVDDHRALGRALLAQHPWADSPALLDQFAVREQLLAKHAGARVVVAPPDDPVSRCLLLRDDDLLEIDDVATLTSHRGAGWSRAVVTRALLHGAESGAAHILLVADADDWPRRWYARLGFRTIGRSTAFVRDPVG